MKFHTPLERIVATDLWALIHTSDPLKDGYRIVDLACGHKHWTNALRRARCPRCQQMVDAGEDYDGFRRLGMPDMMEWPGDPLRYYHEADHARELRDLATPAATAPDET